MLRRCCCCCIGWLLPALLMPCGAGTHTGGPSQFLLQTRTGVGLDFNSDLVEKILKCKGANYMSVHTPGEPSVCFLSVFPVPQHGTCSARQPAAGCAVCWPGSPITLFRWLHAVELLLCSAGMGRSAVPTGAPSPRLSLLSMRSLVAVAPLLLQASSGNGWRRSLTSWWPRW